MYTCKQLYLYAIGITIDISCSYSCMYRYYLNAKLLKVTVFRGSVRWFCFCSLSEFFAMAASRWLGRPNEYLGTTAGHQMAP